MCILFLYIAKQSSSLKNNCYKMILASNRDEFYSRASKSADFWDSDPSILGGQDLQSGGTWLGMNIKNGKIGALLNISGGTDPTKQRTCRGFLITNFLRSPLGLNGWTYCKNLNHDPSFDIREDFNQFNLLTIDALGSEINRSTTTKSTCEVIKNENPPLVTYFTNIPDTEIDSFPLNLTSSIIALGNNVLEKPFRKVSEGGKLFQSIIQSKNYNSESTEDKTELKAKLLQFLKSPTRYFPDPVQESMSQGRTHESVSSVYVNIPEVNYGTRTHTLILIDKENKVDFHEWTKEEPIIATEEPIWKESNFNFVIPSS